MFPFDIFEQAFQGNWVAWYGIIATIGLLAFGCLIFIVWWKMPQLAKSQFLNNTIGGNRPTVAQCHDDKKVRFVNPETFSHGFAYAKGSVYIPIKQWLSGRKDVNQEIMSLVNPVYTIEGTHSPFYINYAQSATMMNPALAAMIEHEEQVQGKGKDDKIQIDRLTFIKVLQSIKDEFIQLKPMYLTYSISDIRSLKQFLPKSVSKSEYREFENKVRVDERNRQERGMNGGTIAILLGVGSLIVGVIIALREFGVI